MKRNVDIIYDSWILMENPLVFSDYEQPRTCWNPMTVTPSCHPFIRPDQPAQSSSSSTAWILRCGNLDAKCLANGQVQPSPAVVETKKNRDDLSNKLGGWSNRNGNWFNGNIWKYEHRMYWEFSWGMYCDWCVMVTYGHPHDGIPNALAMKNRYEHFFSEQSRPNIRL